MITPCTIFPCIVTAFTVEWINFTLSWNDPKQLFQTCTSWSQTVFSKPLVRNAVQFQEPYNWNKTQDILAQATKNTISQGTQSHLGQEFISSGGTLRQIHWEWSRAKTSERAAKRPLRSRLLSCASCASTFQDIPKNGEQCSKLIFLFSELPHIKDWCAGKGDFV